MGDLAVLGLRIESQEVETANRRLDEMPGKSERAERATDALSASYKRAGTATGAMEAEIQKMIRSHGDLVKHARDLGTAMGRMGGDIATGSASVDNLSTNSMNAARSLLGLGGRAAMVGGIVTGLTGIAVAGAMAWRDYDRSVKDVENSLLGAGRATGLTATQFRELADEAAKAGNISDKAAQTMATGYLRAGVVHADVLKDVTALTQRYATVTNQDLNAAQSELGKVLNGSSASVALLEGRIGVLDDKTREHLKTLIEQNNLHEYQKLVVAQVGDAFQVTAVKVNSFDQALKDAGKTWNNFWGSAGSGINDFFRINQTTEQQLASRNRFAGFGYDPIRERLSGQLATEQATAKANADQQEYNRLMRDARNEAEALMPWERRRATVLGQISTIQQAINAQKAANPTGQTDAQLAAALRAAQVQLKQIDETAGRDGARKPRTNNTAANREASLARELEAMRLTAQANRDLAAAYGVSDEAGLKAAARAEIVGRAVKRQGDIDAFVAAQLEVNASKAGAEAARTVADLRKTAEGRERMNALVASGTLSSERANEQLQIEAELRPLLAYANLIEGDAKLRLTGIIDGLKEARERDNAAARDARLIAQNDQERDQLAFMRSQIGMVRMPDRDRAVAMAELARRQELNRQGVSPEDAQYAKAIALAKDLAAAGVDLAHGQNAYNLELSKAVDLARQLDDHMRSAAQGMGEAFGQRGAALGGVLSSLTGYQARLEDVKRAEDDYRLSVGKGGIDQERIAAFARDAAQAQIQSYGDMAGAAKTFFREGSDGYELLRAAEQGYRIFQFAMAIQAMALNSSETGSTLATSSIRAGAYLAEGAAKMFAALGPFGFPAVAAMVAVLASLGLKGKGGGGGGYSPANDNLDRSIDTVQGYAETADQARASAAQAVATQVKVQIELNDPMFKARVQQEAVGVAAPMVAAAAAGTKRDVMDTLKNQQVGNRRAMV